MKAIEKLNSSDFGYPASCSLCHGEIMYAKSAAYLIEPELKAKPYVGKSPKLVLIGQDPTLVNRQVETVFELDRPNSRLRKYVEQEILAPLNFSIDDIYATNAVKCTFPGRTPDQWASVLSG